MKRMKENNHQPVCCTDLSVCVCVVEQLKIFMLLYVGVYFTLYLESCLLI